MEHDYSELVQYAIKIVSKESGNVFSEQHFFLIETKIRKRMMDLNIDSISEYTSYIHANQAEEHQYFISELTTHYTFFFREFRHFEFLQLNLQSIVDDVRSRGQKKIKILCLACSRGQEPYSLSMFFTHHLKQMGINDISFEIEGNDVDKASVEIAQNGVYRYSDIKSIPTKYLGDHWARGKGNIADFVKVKESIKKHCSFRVGNLQKLKTELSGKYDIIFCRNVFIYFDEVQIKSISRNILDHLNPNGIFFTGVSESLTAMNLPIVSDGASVYRHETIRQEKVVDIKPSVSASTPARAAAPKRAATPAVVIPEKLKVLCVDDSKIILSLLKKLFNAKPEFEVVGTAENGEEAREFLKNNKVDVMTLDIHMPVMDGLTYLKENYNSSHPAVVIVSSVSREDAFKAMEGLKLGASDYVEKPSLEDFVVKGDEVCTKLRVAALEKIMGNQPTPFNNIDKEFAGKIIEKPEDCFYSIYAHFTDKKKFNHIIKELNYDKAWPATYLLLEGGYNAFDLMFDEIKKDHPSLKIEKLIPGQYLNKPNTVYVGDFKDNFEGLHTSMKSKKSSTVLLGHHSESAADLMVGMHVKNLLLDDVNFIQKSNHAKIQDLAIDSGPYTSFAYQLKHFVIKEE